MAPGMGSVHTTRADEFCVVQRGLAAGDMLTVRIDLD
jgi:hypothetical protein